MMTRAAAFVLALLIGVPSMGIAADHASTPSPTPLSAAVARAAKETAPVLPTWALDSPHARGAALPALYGTYAGLQVLDVVSTRRALAAGATELNPAMRSGNMAATLAVKAAAGAATIYFTERAWKKNKAGAIILMAVLNGATAAIAARNLRNAHR